VVIPPLPSGAIIQRPIDWSLLFVVLSCTLDEHSIKHLTWLCPRLSDSWSLLNQVPDEGWIENTTLLIATLSDLNVSVCK